MELKKRILSYFLLTTLLLTSMSLMGLLPESLLGGKTGGEASADAGVHESLHPTEFTIEKVDPTFTMPDGSPMPAEGIGAWNRFMLKFNCKIPNGLRAGDTTVITLGDNIKIPEFFEFDLLDVKNTSNVIAKITTTPKTLNLTYTDFVENPANKNITGHISLVVGVDSNVAEVNEALPIHVTENGRQTDLGTIKYNGIPKTHPMVIRKYGKNHFDNRTILYTLRVNETVSPDGKALRLGNILIQDELRTEGASIHRDGFKVQRVKYGPDKSGNDVTVKSWEGDVPENEYEIKVNPDKKGFSLRFSKEVTEDDQYLIEYSVKLSEPFELKNGNEIQNKATLYGETPGEKPAEAYAKVVYSLPEGMASAYSYKILLRKVDAEDQTVGLSGVKFKLTRGSASEESEYYTTDQDGYIRLNNVLNETYTLEEVKPPVGYLLEKSPKTITPTAGGGPDEEILVTNTKIKKKGVTVTKVWGDNSPVNPVSVTLQLLLGENEAGRVTFREGDATREHTFSVDETDIHGNPLPYTVKELFEVNNEVLINNKLYDVAYSGDITSGLVVTNTERVIPVGKRHLKVEKIWASGSVTNEEDTTIELLHKDLVIGSVTFKKGETKKQHYFIVDERDAEGKAIFYDVREVGETDRVVVPGEKIFYTISLGEKLYQVQKTYYISGALDDVPLSWQVRNIEIPTVDVNVVKTWEKTDGAALDTLPVTKVKVGLFRDGVKLEEAELLKDGGWSHTFPKLIKTRRTEFNAFGGEDYVYTVKELDASGNPVEEGGKLTLGGKTFKVSYGMQAGYLAASGLSLKIVNREEISSPGPSLPQEPQPQPNPDGPTASEQKPDPKPDPKPNQPEPGSTTPPETLFPSLPALPPVAVIPPPPVIVEEIEDIPIDVIPAGSTDIEEAEEPEIPIEIEASKEEEELIGIEEDELPLGNKEIETEKEKGPVKAELAKTGGLQVSLKAYSILFMILAAGIVALEIYKRKVRE